MELLRRAMVAALFFAFVSHGFEGIELRVGVRKAGYL